MRSRKVLPSFTGRRDLAFSRPMEVPRPPLSLRTAVLERSDWGHGGRGGGEERRGKKEEKKRGESSKKRKKGRRKRRREEEDDDDDEKIRFSSFFLFSSPLSLTWSSSAEGVAPRSSSRRGRDSTGLISASGICCACTFFVWRRRKERDEKRSASSECLFE